MTFKVKRKKIKEKKSFLIPESEIDFFINNSVLTINKHQSGWVVVGLGYGESKRLKDTFGYSRQRQIAMLNHIEANWGKYKKRFGE